MRKGSWFLLVAIALAGLLVAGCGSGSGTTRSSGVRRTASTPSPHRNLEPGAGMSAPISKVIVARRTGLRRGLVPGFQGDGASGCPDPEGRPEIGLFTDVPAPGCVRAAPTQHLLVVNRSAAYRRSEGHPEVVSLGPFSARLLPQQAILFPPLGDFLGRGLHDVTVDGGNRGAVLVEPEDCAITRAEPGEPLCFPREGARRPRRRKTPARPAAAACHAGDLALAKERHSSIGSGGTIYTALYIRNISSRPCTVAGVPKVVAYKPGGKVIEEAETSIDLRPGSRGGRLRVLIEPGRSAKFLVAYYDGIGAGPCRFATVRNLRVTIPRAGPPRRIIVPMGYCPERRAGLFLRVGRIE